MSAADIVSMAVFTAGALSFLTAVMVSMKSVAGGLPYTAILACVAGLAGWVFMDDKPSPAAVSAALSAFVVFVALPGILGYAARGLSRADRFSAAANLLLIRFPLVASPLAWVDYAAMKAFGLAESGRFDEAEKLLKRARAGAMLSTVRPRVDEAFLDLCLREFRWERGAEYIDLAPDVFDESADANPRLLVYALRVKAELGRFSDCVDLLVRIASKTPASLSWSDLASSWMMFLACAGEREKLTELFRVHERFLNQITPAMRLTWLGRASAASGDLPEADMRFAQARDLAADSQPELVRRIEGHAGNASRSAFGAVEPAFQWPPPLPAGDSAKALESARLFEGGGVIATSALLAVNVIAFFATSIATGVEGETNFTLVAFGANVPFLVEAGQFWRLGSSAFIHVGLAHFLMNSLGLLLLGRTIESMLGPARLLVVYAASAFAGSALSNLLSHAAVSAGASGAIMGMVGAGLACMLLRRDSAAPGARRTYLFLFVFLVAADALFSSRTGYIDRFAHLGGLLGGLLTGSVFAFRGSPGSAARKFIDRAAVALGAACAVALAACVGAGAFNWVSGGEIPGEIPYRVERGFGRRLSLIVPEHWKPGTAQGEALLFDEPLLSCAIVREGPNGLIDVEEAAESAETASWRESQDQPKPVGPQLRKSPSGMIFVSYSRNRGRGFAEESYYFSDGDSLFMMRFSSETRLLRAFRPVISAMLDGVTVGPRTR